MSGMQPIPLASQSYQGRSLSHINERLINLYPEPGPNAETPFVLHATPGLVSWVSGLDGKCRGLQIIADDLYAVCGAKLYAIDTAGTATEIGDIEGLGDCRLSGNETHVIVATSTKLYAANRSEILQLPESGMNGAAFIQGYGILSEQGTQNLWITNLDDMTTITATDFTTVDDQPDNVMGCIADHSELWVFKQRTTEVFRNTGNASFPFERITLIERGMAASHSPVKQDNAVYWIGDDRAVYKADGYQPQRISTPAIEKLIAGFGVESAAAFIYRQEGHVFYVLNFADGTVVYDTTTGKWHERLSGGQTRWRANHYAFFAGKHIVGDFDTGDLYELDLDTYDENGTSVIRTAQLPPLYAAGSRLSNPVLEVNCEAGVGAVGGGAADMMLSWSDDGGKTFPFEVIESIGKAGDYKRLVRFNRLGSFFHRTYRISVSDSVKIAIKSVNARLEVGV